MGEMIEPALLAVALAGGIDEAELARLADAVFGALEKPRLQRDGDRLGKADADEAAGRDRVAGADEARRLARGSDLAALPEIGAPAPETMSRRMAISEKEASTTRY